MLCIALGGPAGCDDKAAERTEARQLIGSLERLRDATDAERLPLLEQLERETAQGAGAERARQQCTAAYRALHESTALEASVRRRLGNPLPPGSAGARASGDAAAPAASVLGPKADEILADLTRAERELERARELMPSCEQALAELRRAVSAGGGR